MWICFISSQPVQYETHIQPIIQDHCLRCHHPGGIAPMPFTNYQEVSSYGQMIQFVTETRYMPPWQANTPDRMYTHQNKLDAEEIQNITNWVSNGMPQATGRTTRTLAFTEKHLPEYDLEIEMAEPFEQYDIYFDQFQVFVIPFDIGHDTMINAVEFIPGENSIVRACHVSITTDSNILQKDSWDPRYGYNSFGGVDFQAEWSHWYSWTAGDVPYELDSLSLLLPSKGYFLFHLHYGPTSDKKLDKSKIRLKFGARDRPLLQTIPLINQENLTIKPFSIPANSKTNLHAMTALNEDIYVHGLFPQSNLICQSWEVYAKLESSLTPVHLLRIDQWDFKWKRNYQFTTPIFLPAGTEIHAFAKFDNTSENLSLPDDQSIQIKWGDQMFEETFLVHFMITNTKHPKKNGVNSNSTYLLPGETVLKPRITYFKLSGTPLKGSYFEFVHWEKGFSKIVAPGEGKDAKKNISIDLKNFPAGNYSLYYKNATGAILSTRIFTLLDPF